MTTPADEVRIFDFGLVRDSDVRLMAGYDPAGPDRLVIGYDPAGPEGGTVVTGWRLASSEVVIDGIGDVVVRGPRLSQDAHSMSFKDMTAEAEAELAAWRGILHPDAPAQPDPPDAPPSAMEPADSPQESATFDVYGPGGLVVWFRATAPAVVAFDNALARVSAAFAAAGAGTLEAILEAAEAMTAEPAEPDLARRRHGHAAVCPKHGPTVGGLCRRCRR